MVFFDSIHLSPCLSSILPSLQINGYVCIWPFERASLAYRTYHSIHIRTVGSWCLLSTLLKRCYTRSWFEKISRWTYEEVCLVGRSKSLCFDIIGKNLLVSGLCKTLWLRIGWKPSRLIEKLCGQMWRFSEGIKDKCLGGTEYKVVFLFSYRQL